LSEWILLNIIPWYWIGLGLLEVRLLLRDSIVLNRVALLRVLILWISIMLLRILVDLGVGVSHLLIVSGILICRVYIYH